MLLLLLLLLGFSDFTLSCICLFIYFPTYLLIYLFIYLFTYTFMYFPT